MLRLKFQNSDGKIIEPIGDTFTNMNVGPWAGHLFRRTGELCTADTPWGTLVRITGNPDYHTGDFDNCLGMVCGTSPGNDGTHCVGGDLLVTPAPNTLNPGHMENEQWSRGTSDADFTWLNRFPREPFYANARLYHRAEDLEIVELIR